ncbi:hypothetical protein FGO68_gene15267 [Halteria grandinella]|uniref:Uncharacterized protein n=1 Tax=Halteria grandinella TaxID=5974 RepID=A0A8J8T8M9_HALGN|nr:hypothetical protein FGO68_gene15267 [Halteria grandinella]
MFNYQETGGPQQQPPHSRDLSKRFVKSDADPGFNPKQRSLKTIQENSESNAPPSNNRQIIQVSHDKLFLRRDEDEEEYQEDFGEGEEIEEEELITYNVNGNVDYYDVNNGSHSPMQIGRKRGSFQGNSRHVKGRVVKTQRVNNQQNMYPPEAIVQQNDMSGYQPSSMHSSFIRGPQHLTGGYIQRDSSPKIVMRPSSNKPRPFSAFPMRGASGKTVRPSKHQGEGQTKLIINDWNNMQGELQIEAQNVRLVKKQPKPVALTDMLNTQYRKRLIPSNYGGKLKEELYDQNIALKLNINDYKDDNLRLRTRMKQMVAQLRGRDKLIDELYKSAYITLNGAQASSNLNKDALLLINLKREVQDLKDQLYLKDDEITSLRMSMKLTKLKELETELRLYVAECLRLRKITEQAVRLSGEIDLQRLERQLVQERERYEGLVRNMRSDIGMEKDRLKEAREREQQLQKQVSAESEAKDKVQREKQAVDRRLEELEQDKERVEKDLKRERETVNSLEDELRNIKSSQSEAMRLHRTETDGLNQTMADIKAQLSEARKVNERKDKSIADLEEQIKTLQNEIDWQRDELVELRGKNIESETVQEGLKEEIKALQSENQKITTELRDKIREYLDQQEKFHAQLQLQTKEKQQIRQELERETTAKLQQAHTQFDRQINEMREQIEDIRVSAGERESLLKAQLMSLEGVNHKLKNEVEQLQSQLKNTKQRRKSSSSSDKSDRKKSHMPPQDQKPLKPQMDSPISKIDKTESVKRLLNDSGKDQASMFLDHSKSEENTRKAAQQAPHIQAPEHKQMKEAGISMKGDLEYALNHTLQVLLGVVKALKERKVGSIRGVLSGKVYIVPEEDTQEEMEFIAVKTILEVLKVTDDGEHTAEKILGEYVRFDLVCQLCEKLGWQEDMPESKKHLNYKVLNLQSKRILNRLNAYTDSKDVTVEALFQSIKKIQVVKTKSKQEDVELLKAEDFFKCLHTLKIVKSPKVKDNLCKFLCIDEAYLGSLMFKKLIRACKDFNQSQALCGVGVKKVPLPGMEKEAPQQPKYQLPPIQLPRESQEQIPQQSLAAKQSQGNIFVPPSEDEDDKQSEYEYDEEEVSYDAQDSPSRSPGVRALQPEEVRSTPPPQRPAAKQPPKVKSEESYYDEEY